MALTASFFDGLLIDNSAPPSSQIGPIGLHRDFPFMFLHFDNKPAKVTMSESKAAKAAAKAAAKVLRQSNNEWSNKYFAIAIGSIMCLFAVYHWLSVIHFHYGPRKSHPALSRSYR